jgi:hypothetical protein
MNNTFEKKYLKYKLKYNNLKQIGGFVFNWPNDWHDIVGSYSSGKKFILIKSITGDIQTHNKLGISDNITIPGLTGFIEKVDRDNLIVKNLTDKDGNVKIIGNILFNKENDEEVNIEFVDKIPVRVGTRPGKIPKGVLSEQVSPDGNHIFTWPDNWQGIAGALVIPKIIGKNIVEIRSMTVNGYTNKKLNISDDLRIPGLAGTLESVDENNLIIIDLKDKNGKKVLDNIHFNRENVGEVRFDFISEYKIQPKLYSHHREIPIIMEPKNSQNQSFDQHFNQFDQPSVINPAAPNTTNIFYSDENDDILSQTSPMDYNSSSFHEDTFDAKSTSKLMHMGKPIPMYYGMPMTCCIPMICGMGIYGMGSYGISGYGMGSHSMGIDSLKLSKVQDIKDIDNKPILELSEKIRKLESEFKNHHHDIPTSGVRTFDDNQHPYFKKS